MEHRTGGSHHFRWRVDPALSLDSRLHRRAVLGHAAVAATVLGLGGMGAIIPAKLGAQDDARPQPIPLPGEGVPVESEEQLAAASAEDLAAYLRQSGEEPLATQALAQVFARVGVRVYSDIDGQLVRPVGEPYNALEFLEWQVSSLAGELHDGVTMAGADLDALLSANTDWESGIPRPSEMLAAWVHVSDTPGAAFARAWMGHPDLAMADAIGYPAAIISLFSADFMDACLTNDVPSNHALGQTLSAPAVAQVTGCGQAEQFISSVFGAIENAIASGAKAVGLPAFLMDILGFIVGSVATAAELLVAPVLGVIRGIGAALTVASYLSASLVPWTVKIVPDPEFNAFGSHATGGNYGKVTVVVDGLQTSSWPPVIAECASLAGIALPAESGAGAQLEASVVHKPPPIVLATWAPPPSAMDARGEALWDYVTKTEPEGWSTGGFERIGIMGVSAKVTRNDLIAVRDMLVDGLFGSLPGFVASVLQPLIGSTVRDLSQKLIDLASVTAYRPVYVRYHDAPVTPTVEPTEEPTVPPVQPESACFIGTFTGGWDGIFDARVLAETTLQVTGTDGAYVYILSEDGSVLLSGDYVVLFANGAGQDFQIRFVGEVAGRWAYDDSDRLQLAWRADTMNFVLEIYALGGTLVNTIPGTDYLGDGWKDAKVTCTESGFRVAYEGYFGSSEFELIRLAE